MKEAKSRRKLLRVDCLKCGSTQDALRSHCGACGNLIYANLSEEELGEVNASVDALEELLGQIEAPKEKHANPYIPMDKAFQHYKTLRKFEYIPAMSRYLEKVLEVLIPLRIKVLEKTTKANLLFAIFLFSLPAICILFKVKLFVVVFMLLPAVAWLFVTYKAKRDLDKARQRLLKAQGS
jgi:hypothetical protein